METHERSGVETQPNPRSPDLAATWSRKPDEQSLCFAAGFTLGGTFDLAPLTGSLPEAVVVCDSSMVAGIEHLEQVLFQAHEFWKGGGGLAKKKSIDLLMRITCQRQISDAISLSKIENASNIAIFGIVKSRELVEKSLQLIFSRFPSAKREDTLLELGKQKTEFLRKVHGLPRSLTRSQIVVALKERSALLVFSN